MTKAELRKKYKVLRQELSQTQVDNFSLAIANQLLKIDIWDKSFYHVFLSIAEQKEVNTEYILSILSGKDKHIVVSQSNFEDFTMTHYLLTDATKIIINHYNIPEPQDGIKVETSQIEVVFIPLLAFDKAGNRVGYGKGFYDRFLADCKPETFKIGLSFFDAETEIFEVSDNDTGLNYCVTPKKIYKF